MRAPSGSRSVIGVDGRVREDPVAADWAAVLQDETLQGLAAARTLLAAGMRQGSQEALERAASDAVRQIDDEIVALRELLDGSRGSAPAPDGRFRAAS